MKRQSQWPQLFTRKLLIIDELRYVPLLQTSVELLFEVSSQKNIRARFRSNCPVGPDGEQGISSIPRVVRRRPFGSRARPTAIWPSIAQCGKKAGGFLDLCYTPELAAEVTLQPIRRFGFDAAVLFSDIPSPMHSASMSPFAKAKAPRSTCRERQLSSVSAARRGR